MIETERSRRQLNQAAIRAIMPHLSPRVAAMVELQNLTGARPQEVIAIRPCEVDTSGDVWLYQPRSHKTTHLDRGKVIVLGPRAQEVLRPWLDRDPESICFVPAETSAWHYRRLRRRAPSVDRAEGGQASEPKLAPGQRYTRHSYRVAIQRACRRAGIPVWSPRKLRHTRATLIRQAYGLEAAKAVLGHASRWIIEIYAGRDLELAMRIMREIGGSPDRSIIRRAESRHQCPIMQWCPKNQVNGRSTQEFGLLGR